MTDGDGLDGVEAHAAKVRSCVAKNDGGAGLSGTFPDQSLSALADETFLPDAMAEDLLSLLSIAGRSAATSDTNGRNVYEGDDLRRQASVIRALARLRTPSEPIAVAVASLLETVVQPGSSAKPGSPDPDNYDRDVAVERAQDDLADACATALGRHGGAAKARALEALEKARTHRDVDVRFVVTQVSRLLAE